MTRAMERAQRAGAARATLAAARLAARLADELPAARIETRDGEITIIGRQLRLEAALRWPGGLLR